MINTITFTECHDLTQPVSALNMKKIKTIYSVSQVKENIPYEGNATGVSTISKP